MERTEIGSLEGWPIHLTFGHGWLWYSGGYHAVEFIRTRGGPVTVGTDDPQGLCEAVERFRKGAA